MWFFSSGCFFNTPLKGIEYLKNFSQWTSSFTLVKFTIRNWQVWKWDKKWDIRRYSALTLFWPWATPFRTFSHVRRFLSITPRRTRKLIWYAHDQRRMTSKIIDHLIWCESPSNQLTRAHRRSGRFSRDKHEGESVARISRRLWKTWYR
jgi:hypothetical protein